MCASLLLPIAKQIPVSKTSRFPIPLTWSARLSLPWPLSVNLSCHAWTHGDVVHRSNVLQVHELRPEMLADARARLVSGLKRYFHQKRIEGLLSSTVSGCMLTAASGTLRTLAWRAPVCSCQSTPTLDALPAEQDASLA